MTRVHVAGASGYAGSEFIRLALRHPGLELGVLESASRAGAPIANHVAALHSLARDFDSPGDLAAQARPGEVAVLAGGADLARELAPPLLERGLRVIDFSDAFRLHAHAGDAVYGLPERYEAAIRGARLVANPGCYPTAVLLALLPLAPFAADLVQIVVDAKSGITGAGRTPATSSLFAEVDGDVRPYGLDGHRHQAEIEQELAAAGILAPLVFTPHVVPLRRGLLADAYAFFERAPDENDIRASFARAYGGSPFLSLLRNERAPSLLAVAGTNDVELHVTRRGRVVRVIAALDNLGKGAAGQAMQNINLMLGLPEASALDDCALVS